MTVCKKLACKGKLIILRRMKAAVIVFPGSNCDRDIYTVLQSVWGKGGTVQKVWHGDSELPKVDLAVIPGGFSYGDYLRCGAMAAHSPIMREVIAHAKRGGLTLGICNGFQILTETGLLPGTLMQNAGLKFLCKETHLRVEFADTAFTREYKAGQVINIPIAHHEGNYFADERTLAGIEEGGQVAFRYCTPQGQTDEAANPNGSLHHIAGIFNKNKNVLGMMPHPERHADAAIGRTDGIGLFTSLLQAA